MLKVGLTGCIGAGKTTVAKIFESLGVPVFYADTAAKKCYELPEVKEKIIALLGAGVYDADGGVKTKAVSEKVFADKALLQQLNAILHPATIAMSEAWMQEQQRFPYVIKEAALLLESNAHKLLDMVICVRCPEEERIARVMERDSASREQVLQRMANQWTEEQKATQSQYFIDNDEEPLISQVVDLHNALIKKSKSKT